MTSSRKSESGQVLFWEGSQFTVDNPKLRPTLRLEKAAGFEPATNRGNSRTLLLRPAKRAKNETGKLLYRTELRLTKHKNRIMGRAFPLVNGNDKFFAKIFLRPESNFLFFDTCSRSFRKECAISKRVWDASKRICSSFPPRSWRALHHLFDLGFLNGPRAFSRSAIGTRVDLYFLALQPLRNRENGGRQTFGHALKFQVEAPGRDGDDRCQTRPGFI